MSHRRAAGLAFWLALALTLVAAIAGTASAASGAAAIPPSCELDCPPPEPTIDPPTAALAGPTTPPFTNQVFTMSAAGSDGGSIDENPVPISKYEWDLDGVSGYEHETPGDSIAFAFANNFTGRTVRVKVTSPAGTATATTTLTVQNRPPVASFTLTPETILTQQSTTLNSTGSTDSDGVIVERAWDLDNDGQFDDGSATTGSMTILAPGTYTFRLRVTDDDGATAVASRVLTVQNRPPVASFTASTPLTASGESVTFTSTSTDPDGTAPAEEHLWEFIRPNGNQWQAVGGVKTISRAFPTPGLWTVRLHVKDNRGVSDPTPYELTVQVQNRFPSPSFTVGPAAPKSLETVTFTDTSEDADGFVASRAWDLDEDGQFDDGTGTTATRVFAKPGTYRVELEVVDDLGLVAVRSVNVTVGNRAPTAGFMVAPAAPVAGSATTFTSTSADADGSLGTQAWDLDGDGEFDDASGPTATRTYAAGAHVVKLLVTDDKGETALHAQTVTVAAAPIVPPPVVESCVVPALKGKTLAQAKTALAAAKCSVGTVKKAYSASVKKGRVVKQAVAAGRKLTKGSAVGLTLSKGRRP